MNLDFDNEASVKTVKKLYTLISVDIQYDNYRKG